MELYGIIGDPVEHSLSPPMQGAAYEATGVDATYSRYRVEEDDVGDAVRGADALSIDGLNVTVPHKESVAALDDVTLDETAERIGAVNTLDFGGEDDEIRGYNTDAEGALRAIERETDVSGQEVVVVGAGGAGRAVAFALTGKGATVAVVNRTLERAEALAEEVREVGDATAHPLEALDGIVPDADIVVNATTVGMEEDVSPVPAEALRPHHVVFDAVYTPLRTRLLRDAADAGATTVEGAWMLVYQGAEAFEIWTGREAPVDEMNDALREEL
ncbi:MAG: shikimate dehydrogenase [Halobacteria archaeon]